MVHGRTAYIVACGPRMKGSKPGSVSAWGSAAVSAAVYSGLTVMPSGVTQSRAETSPPGADLAAAFFHCSRVAGWKGVGASALMVGSSVWQQDVTILRPPARRRKAARACPGWSLWTAADYA